MGTISKNFSYSEFEASKTAERHQLCNAIRTFYIRDCVKALVDHVLQPLRDAWGKPLKINSGYRSPEVNSLVGGVNTSQHVLGQAADIEAQDPFELARCAREIGIPFDQMILYPTFVHFSYDKDKAEQRHQTLYAKTYKGPKF